MLPSLITGIRLVQCIFKHALRQIWGIQMKITKNIKNGQTEFYRNTKSGSLKKQDNERECTSEIIESLDLDKSFVGRILSYDKERGAGNPFLGFTQSLVKEEKSNPLDGLSICALVYKFV